MGQSLPAENTWPFRIVVVPHILTENGFCLFYFVPGKHCVQVSVCSRIFHHDMSTEEIRRYNGLDDSTMKWHEWVKAGVNLWPVERLERINLDKSYLPINHNCNHLEMFHIIARNFLNTKCFTEAFEAPTTQVVYDCKKLVVVAIAGSGHLCPLARC